ncbi:MAG TPA: prepilin-type N-terminal cleavage/methylation domain-containing protein [Longimicrobiales bacterium]|nr:prepilin-type N-terminal cleavage/methylation domain-containing protein [Longimicrobiales bacterium]
MTDRRGAAARRERAGFTLIELVMAVVLSAMILGAVFQLVFAQNRMYGHQQGLADARQTLRAAGSLLAWELRHLSAAGGDIYAIGADSVSVRSFDGAGVVCRKRVTDGKYGLYSTTGDIAAGDSALVYLILSNRTADDVWRTVSIQQVNTAAGFLMNTACAIWPGPLSIEMAVELGISANADTAGMRVGAPLRTFHRRTYRMIQRNDKWWLGVRQGDGSYQLLTGPLQAGDGLELRYMDAAGASTTVPANVRAVEFVLRSESQIPRTPQDVQEDSVVMRVQLRG